jgi:molybdopterin-guanine dinucleotide biosynthesis protein A
VGVGAVLAGGAGTRLVGEVGPDARDRPRAPSKAVAPVAGRPLVSYPIAALAEVCGRVAVLCKRDTELPELGEVERWDEPDEPRHPLLGIVHALERARTPVLVCAADMPFVTASACRELLAVSAVRSDAAAVVAATEEGLEPLLGVYGPGLLPRLRAALGDEPLRATVGSLAPVRVELPAPMLWSVNTPAELEEAAKALGAESARAARR